MPVGWAINMDMLPEVGIYISNGVNLEISSVHIRGHKSTTEAFLKCLQEKVEQTKL